MNLVKDMQESDENKDVYHIDCANCGYRIWGFLEHKKVKVDEFD